MEDNDYIKEYEKERKEREQERFKKRFGQSYEEEIKERINWHLFKNKLFKSIGLKSGVKSRPSLLGLTIYVLISFSIIYGVIKFLFN
tara:strand:- start:317 stop:577 length:261 start_codon:yes stop_codon:yes gene_type:complete